MTYANGASINKSELRTHNSLADNIDFLREQLKNKDEIINTLLQELSKNRSKSKQRTNK